MKFAEYDKKNKDHKRRIKRIKRLIMKLYAGEIDEIHVYIKDIREGFL
ncbi:hypothetical protein LCGC14_2164110 [marine sediment metagenome]|uniref:Uncharacterized protein n=1 Tax=marine sediment metagenome TaxID=412755 RepID=A0A0F9EE45_9ZZZZ